MRKHVLTLEMWEKSFGRGVSDLMPVQFAATAHYCTITISDHVQ